MENIFNEQNEEYFIEESKPNYNINKDFSTLRCWDACRDTKLFFYKIIIPKIPHYESTNLISQIRRASISITANIAEGYGRYHFQEGIQFYRISRASLYELKDHLISCYDLGYIDQKINNTGISHIEKAKKLLNGFIKYVQKQKSINK